MSSARLAAIKTRTADYVREWVIALWSWLRVDTRSAKFGCDSQLNQQQKKMTGMCSSGIILLFSSTNRCLYSNLNTRPIWRTQTLYSLTVNGFYMTIYWQTCQFNTILEQNWTHLSIISLPVGYSCLFLKHIWCNDQKHQRTRQNDKLPEKHKYYTVTDEKKRDNKCIPGAVHVNSNIPRRQIYSSAKDNTVSLPST